MKKIIVVLNLCLFVIFMVGCSKLNEMNESAKNLKSDVENGVSDAKESLENITEDLEEDGVDLEGLEEALLTQETGSEEGSEGTSEEGGLSDQTPSVEWPKDIPSEIPQLTGVNITAAIPNGTGQTMMFETDSADAVKSYIMELETAGFIQSSLDEDKFSLNYYGENGSKKIFINCIFGGLSKISIEY